MRSHWQSMLCILAVVFSSYHVAMGEAAAEKSLRVLPETIEGGDTADMMRRYLIGQAYAAWDRWKETFESTKTPEQIDARNRMLRETFLEKLGAFPERTPLDPRIVGTLQRDGYRVEQTIFEGQPGLYVSAAFFLPDSPQWTPPYPGVLVPCGHADNAKAYESYQTMGAFLALNGMAALVFDPIEQGERMQLLDENGKPRMWGTQAHTMIGIGSILLGRNTAWFEVWDGMRGIDYLQSRPEIDPQRIGCTGNSGGGTQTSYLMALDERIVCAAPSCYVHTLPRQLESATGDAEQNVFGQLAWGMDHADYVMMRAPKPTFIAAATQDFFDIRATWETFRFAKRRYSALGYSNQVDMLENDEKHNYNQTQREAIVRWMARWLQHRDEHIVEPAIQIFKDEELWCSPEGQVILLDGARSTYEINAAYEEQLAEQRRGRWNTDKVAAIKSVRALAGVRPLAELPEPVIEQTGVVALFGRAGKKLILKPEDGILLPALYFPGNRGATLLVRENGFGKAAATGGVLETLLKSGASVLAVDLRGTGETKQTKQDKFGAEFSSDWEDYFAAYALGKSYVGMRAEDLLVCARWLGAETGAPITLHAIGNVGVPALHAAALEPNLFAAIRVVRTLESWASVVHTWPTDNQLINTVHAALTVYDLPDLAAELGDKLTLEQPLNTLGAPVSEGKSE